MKKIFLKIASILSSVCILLCSFMVTIMAVDIRDPMLLKAINNFMKQGFPNRSETQEILEADVPYITSLNASNLAISDISGLEDLVYIQSVIDLSKNKIEDITPLINWVNNKEDKNLNVNIFLGGNPVLSTDNYKQIYTLLEMGENIKVYDSQRDGGGVVELTGFSNGRPVDKLNFDDKGDSNSAISNLKDDQVGSQNKIDNMNQERKVVNTGVSAEGIYFVSSIVVLCVLLMGLYKQRKVINQ